MTSRGAKRREAQAEWAIVVTDMPLDELREIIAKEPRTKLKVSVRWRGPKGEAERRVLAIQAKFDGERKRLEALYSKPGGPKPKIVGFPVVTAVPSSSLRAWLPA